MTAAVMRCAFVLAIVVSSTAVYSQQQETRDNDFGARWIREHPLTIMALTLRDGLFDVEEYTGANLNVALIWETQPMSLQACATAGSPWMQRLPALGGNDKQFQSRVNELIAAYPGNIGWIVNDEPFTPQDMKATGEAIAWLKANHPDRIAMSNMGAAPDYLAHTENYIKMVRPDIMMFDTYPFSYEGVETPRDMEKYLYRMGVVRHVSLREGLPYWAFLQGYENVQHPYLSESDVRMQIFASLAHGYTGLAYFTYDPAEDGGRGLLDIDGSTNSIYNAAAGANAEAIRMGETLKLLKSTNIGYASINELAAGLARWDVTCGPYITSVTARDKAGDVLIGYFVPAETKDGETYFMVVNLLRAHGKSAVETRQQVRLTFDFGDSGIQSLQRLSRLTGEVESVPLTHDGGSKYHVDLLLDGGTGDLFKFNTGAAWLRAAASETVAPVMASAAKPQGVDLGSLDDWDIVVAEDAAESERYAAEEFQKYYAEVGGVTLSGALGLIHLGRRSRS